MGSLAKQYASAAILFLVCTAASAQSPLSTPRQLKFAHDTGLSGCQLEFETARLETRTSSAGASTDYRTCIKNTRAEYVEHFRAVSQNVTNPAARSALADAHVAFIAALEGIPAGPNERRDAYANRQQALLDKLNGAWARFEISQ
jgi:predicted outer membrane protein